MGITRIVRIPSCTFIDKRTVTIPKISTRSPIANTDICKASCIAATSPCNLDINLPTSVLSINEIETSCKCINIFLLKSRRIFSPTFSIIESDINIEITTKTDNPRY